MFAAYAASQSSRGGIEVAGAIQRKAAQIIECDRPEKSLRRLKLSCFQLGYVKDNLARVLEIVYVRKVCLKRAIDSYDPRVDAEAAEYTRDTTGLPR
jgi:hypothetical protein